VFVNPSCPIILVDLADAGVITGTLHFRFLLNISAVIFFHKVRCLILVLGLLISAEHVCPAQPLSGTGWHFSFTSPYQINVLSNLYKNPSAVAVVDRWVSRFNELAAGDYGCMSTYTITSFVPSSGYTSSVGRLLIAMSNALYRGATVGFVAGETNSVYTNIFDVGFSFALLQSQYSNTFSCTFVNGNGIMHHKMGTFYYAGQEPWALSGSWNMGDASCSDQWNLLAEIQSHDLSRAVSNEIAQLLNGINHTNSAKIHYDTTFQFTGGWTNGIVRFSPQINTTTNNIANEIVKIIDQAQKEIYFGINILTVNNIGAALIRAADRGVIIRGTINKGSRTVSGSEYARLVTATNYTSDNMVRMFDAYMKADHSATESGSVYDSGSSLAHLVHCKYMVVDPWGDRPWVISGSANWTDTAMINKTGSSANDENCFLIPHAGIAQAFMEHFRMLTDGLNIIFDPDESLRLIAGSNGQPQIELLGWAPAETPFKVYYATNLTDNAAMRWQLLGDLLPSQAVGTNYIGRLPAPDSPAGFYRINNN